MFDLLTYPLTLLLSTALPTFLTYKALSLPPHQQTSATLHPWLTYWVINSLVLSFPRIIPFDGLIRLGLHAYLLIPGRAEALYQGYVAPWLREHEGSIEEYIASIHAQVRGYLGDVISKARELLAGGGEAQMRVKQEQEAEEQRRREAEAGAGGYISNLLARWTSEARVQEQKHVTASNAGEATLATRLGQMANQAAVAGVGKLEQTVQEAGKSVPSMPGTSDAGQPRSSGLFGFGGATTQAQTQTQTSSSSDRADLTKSRSELDFEKIEQHDAPSTDDDKAPAKKGGGWGGWLWGEKSSSSTKGAKAE